MDNYFLNLIISGAPDAAAYVRGSEDYPGIKGIVRLYGTRDGTLVCSEVCGLPFERDNPFMVFAYHIHSGASCTGDAQDPFADTLGHFNPKSREHPYHAGDLPPLFGNYGFAWNAVFTARFKPAEVIGKTVVIHKNPDDFVSQPSGNSGAKIACGVIQTNSRF